LRKSKRSLAARIHSQLCSSGCLHTRMGQLREFRQALSLLERVGDEREEKMVAAGKIAEELVKGDKRNLAFDLWRRSLTRFQELQNYNTNVNQNY
jgi:hypothetical protein